MVADSVNKRSPFISKLVSFCKYFDVSGVDVDWEDYPEPVNRASYKQFIEQLSDSLHSKNIKLSVALGPFQKKADFGADIKDFVEGINIMTYGKLDAAGKHSTFNQMTDALGFYSGAGVPKEKLIVGVPFFGKRTGSGRTPPIALSYSYIYNNAVQKPAETDNSSIISNTIYEYNNLSLLEQKVNYLRKHSYGGIMAWSLLQDTSVVSEKSLLRKIYETNQSD